MGLRLPPGVFWVVPSAAKAGSEWVPDGTAEAVPLQPHFYPIALTLPIVIRVEYSSACIVIRWETAAMTIKKPAAADILQGTLDMLILRTLVMGPAHGHTIAEVIEHTSENALDVEQGSLYPALHRLQDRGMVSSEWGVSENNRRAKFYRLTPKGRKELAAATSRWQRMTRAIGLILGESIE
jgi:PadR family transcriptional regulator, regulatory protein PadR